MHEEARRGVPGSGTFGRRRNSESTEQRTTQQAQLQQQNMLASLGPHVPGTMWMNRAVSGLREARRQREEHAPQETQETGQETAITLEIAPGQEGAAATKPCKCGSTTHLRPVAQRSDAGWTRQEHRPQAGRHLAQTHVAPVGATCLSAHTPAMRPEPEQPTWATSSSTAATAAAIRSDIGMRTCALTVTVPAKLRRSVRPILQTHGTVTRTMAS